MLLARLKDIVTLSAFGAVALFLVSCGGGGNDSTPGPSANVTERTVETGRFIDSPVIGISYIVGDEVGVTDETGSFRYVAGSKVQFKVGDIMIGEALGQSIVTPVDLVSGARDERDSTVTNITRFLLAVDDDANPDNGITLTEIVRDLGIGKAINFAQAPEVFENDGDVQVIVAELTAGTHAGARALVTTETAQAHLKSSLLDLLKGSYEGALTNAETGVWTFAVSRTGNVTGTATLANGGTLPLSGAITSSGDVQLGVSTFLTITGSISRSGGILGTWRNTSSGENGTLSGEKTSAQSIETDPSLSADVADASPRVKLATNLGDIVIELNESKAPITVTNFLRYVEDEFYDGTIFHRVIDDFMIQGGGFTESYIPKQSRDPITNEAANGLKNVRGAIAMARSSDPHSATSQFFINVVDNDFLNYRASNDNEWGYAVFGKVVSGMDIVDAINSVKTAARGPFREDAPQQTVVILSATVVDPAGGL